MKTIKRRSARRTPRRPGAARRGPPAGEREEETRVIDTGLEPDASPKEDFANEAEDVPVEFESVDDELHERGMHIIEPPGEKFEQGVKPAGGSRRGEPMRLLEEEDDFEDGRSSGGTYSRLEFDRWGRGQTASERSESRSGVASVDEGDAETSRGAQKPDFDVSPEEKGVLVTPEMRRPSRRRRGRARSLRGSRGARRGARRRTRGG